MEIHLKALAVASCAWAVLVSVGHAQAPDGQVVVLGRGVACRAAPSQSGSVVERLDVADLLNRAASQSEAPDWVPVEVADGRVCFVSRRLVTDFDVDLPERAVIAIVESTARMTGRIPFGRMAVVHALFENRRQGITVDGSAEMELLELQVLERTARSISHEDLSRGSESDRSRGLRRGDARRADIAAWLDRHERRLAYFNFGARWGVERRWFRALHDRYRGSERAQMIRQSAGGFTYVTIDLYPLNPILETCNELVSTPPETRTTPGSEIWRYLPRLTLPDDANLIPLLFETPSGGHRSASTGVTLEIDLSAQNLVDHFETELQEQGWRHDTGWSGRSSSGSIRAFSPADDLELTGVLDVVSLGESRYHAYFRATALVSE